MRQRTGHWGPGFVGHVVGTARYRGIGTGVPVLLLVGARGTAGRVSAYDTNTSSRRSIDRR
jgi:hypothetical protein